MTLRGWLDLGSERGAHIRATVTLRLLYEAWRTYRLVEGVLIALCLRRAGGLRIGRWAIASFVGQLASSSRGQVTGGA